MIDPHLLNAILVSCSFSDVKWLIYIYIYILLNNVLEFMASFETHQIGKSIKFARS